MGKKATANNSKAENSSPGSFVTSSTRPITTENKAEHDEVTISKKTWENICAKVNKINFDGIYGIDKYIHGSLFPIAVNFIIDVFSNEEKTASYKQLAVWVVIFVIYWILKNIFHLNYLAQNNDSENKVHLEDIREWVNEINSKKVNKL